MEPSANPDTATVPVGRNSDLTDADIIALLETAREFPDFGADLIARVLSRRLGRMVSDNSVRYALVKRGWRRMTRPPPAGPQGAEPPPPDPTRYTEVHRPQGSQMSYPSDVTDEEWALIEPLLRGRRRPSPCGESTRRTLNAIFYVARTGCQWRYLPHDFPKWRTVAATYYRWVDRGVWEKVNEALRRQVRIAAGRNPEPSAAIIDSQSVKTTEKGGPAASTRERRSTVESARSS